MTTDELSQIINGPGYVRPAPPIPCPGRGRNHQATPGLSACKRCAPHLFKQEER